MSSTDGESTALADTVATSAELLDLACRQASNSTRLVHWVAIEDSCRHAAGRKSLHGVVHDGSALRVAGDGDLGVRASFEGLLSERGHDGTATSAHLRIGGDGSGVVDALDGLSLIHI